MLLVDLSESVRSHGDTEAAADSLVADDTSDRWAHRRELQQFIRQKLAAVGLKPHKSLDHALVLETIASAPNREAADVNGIYKMLCDDGQPLFMSKLYRVLKALEQVGLLERSFEEDKHGRVRSVYRVQGLSEQPRPQSRLICRSCGATTLSSSVTLGREIATAAREGGLPSWATRSSSMSIASRARLARASMTRHCQARRGGLHRVARALPTARSAPFADS